MDVFTIRLVVACLGAIAALCVGGMVICEVGDKPVPQNLFVIAMACVTALVGILAAPARTAPPAPPPAPGAPGQRPGD